MIATAGAGALAAIQPWPLRLVISGLQTGADQGGLAAAKQRGYETGGMMPLGYKTEVGPLPELAQFYNVTQSRYAGYDHRTRMNIMNADATIVFVQHVIDGGSALTRLSALALDKPLAIVTFDQMDWTVDVPPQEIQDWIRSRGFRVLNVAGNRESKSPGIFDHVCAFMMAVLPVLT